MSSDPSQNPPFLSPEEQSELIRIASLYRDAKMIILYAEEVDPTISANIQIVKELRDALDHVMRVFINKSSGDLGNGSYGLAQVDKAIGHVYRAAFDALDGTVLSLKIKINDCLIKYDKAVIKEVLPEYWNYKILLNSLCGQISENRGNKDVEKNHETLFDKYIAEVEELKKAYDAILRSGPALDECQSDFEASNKKSSYALFGSAIAGGVAGAILAFFLTYFYTGPNAPQNSTDPKSVTTSPIEAPRSLAEYPK